MADTMSMILLLSGAALVQAQSWPAQWFNETSGCVGQSVSARCAELQGSDFQIVDVNNTFSYLWSPSSTAGHGGCSVDGNGNNPCGQADFRIYCQHQAVVRFEATVQATQFVGNDDSFWVFTDNNTQNGITQLAGFGDTPGAWFQGRRLVNNFAWVLEQGEHVLNLREREDESRVASLSFIQGYPTCTFGRRMGANETVDSLHTRLIDLETESQNAINVVAGDLSIATSTMSEQISNLTSSLDAANSRINDLQNQLTNQVGSVNNTLDSIVSKLTAVNTFSVTNGQTQSTPSVESNDNDVIIKAGRSGDVKVSGSTCSNTDICEMANALRQLTRTLGD